MDITYRAIEAEEINLALFADFIRTQEVTQCWRKVGGEWVIKAVAFTDDWSEKEYADGAEYLKDLVLSGGLALGLFTDGRLKGFTSVEPELFGNGRYLDMSNLHVSRDMRRKGCGKALFGYAAAWAKAHGAKKLYISAHSSVESQAFYRAMGCTYAVEINSRLAELEPFDVQMEYVL